MSRIASGLAFSFILMGAGVVRAEWKDMNADISATNFIVGGVNGEPTCTGTLISLKYRLVLTADHCVEDNISVEEKDETDKDGEVRKVKREVLKDVHLSQKSYQGFREVGRTEFQATIEAHKKAYDLAILKIRADAIPQTSYSHVLPESKTVKRGDPVYVVGNPMGLDASVSAGLVSSTTRTLKAYGDEERPFFQISAAASPGNSGGALYNADGELIGVPAEKIVWQGAEGLTFAIPASEVRKFLSENCYEDVWKDDAKSHDQCVAAKFDEENKRREKAGLPPLEKGEKSSWGGDAKTAPMTLPMLDACAEWGRAVPGFRFVCGAP